MTAGSVPQIEDSEEILKPQFDPFKFPAREHLEMVDLEKIKKHTCTNKECYSNGQPHRHQRDECKLHPYCLIDPLTEQMPVQMRVPQPLPVPLEEGKEGGSLTKSFLNGYE